MSAKTVLYLDSSVLVGLALNSHSSASQKALDLMRHADDVVTSELAAVECQSGISAQLSALKATHQTALVEQNLNRLLSALHLIAVSSLVLGHARALVKRYRVSVGLRTLDAVHLATANLLLQGLTTDDSKIHFCYLTADHRQHEAFSTEGLLGDLL